MNYKAEDLLLLARRNYEGSRKFVVVNPFQGKHLPVRPEGAFAMMRRLGCSVREAFQGERLLCVGFAETATAIGAVVADVCNCAYIHTTRERSKEDSVDDFTFCETHSRWPEQRLRSRNWERLVRDVDRIVFVEDEISTGKTIRTLASVIRERGAALQTPRRDPPRFAAAALVNELDAQDSQLLHAAGIQEIHLAKAENNRFDSVASAMEPDLSLLYEADDLPEPSAESAAFIEIGGKVDPRNGLAKGRYGAACARFAEELSSALALEYSASRILVLGTEEFMFPALYVARFLEQKYPDIVVYTHSTTLSPIAPCSLPGYPISSAYRLRSVHDRARESFVYNLAPYDSAVVVTDSELDSVVLKDVLRGAYKALAFAGVKKITAVRWKTMDGQDERR
ncbi:MAG: phosphoribosyltransferase family protein [Treponema sp.]|nr:phosphoribosyltransferase family protein [Treponema sp.]